MISKLGIAAARRRKPQAGFTLLETMIAIVVLMFGVLSLAATFAAGITYMATSQDDFIAQQKAQEAVESIFTARDSNAVPFSSIANTSNGGIFTTGSTLLCNPGADGIVGTTDDDCAANAIDSIVEPGPDGILGTADDISIPLKNFTRTIAIAPVSTGLNSITVTINYTSGKLSKQYQLVTYISSSF
ncbi:MAG TPA: prepilin-type N-terminal cleavage/methylation domain-containing protein [Candidatus Aquilonibacter sp.]|nr:prepilin-type N-terminal cleavage/methylation domain-containing protein [Candidatus Aquilonibacter sp.]